MSSTAIKNEETTEAMKSAGEILARGLKEAKGNVALASSFSVEDIIVIDLLQQIAPETSVFAIDTGRLNEETYEAAESVSMRYGIHIDWYFPRRQEIEALEREKGLFSFRESLDNRHECCRIRKVEPLQRALNGLSGWITGLRKEQSPTRENLAGVELDETNGEIIKINPLIEWTEEDVWDYAKEKRIPANRLHRMGYPSIGCAPCTRAIEKGEHPRAGRWWWENPEHKECGLHRR